MSSWFRRPAQSVAAIAKRVGGFFSSDSALRSGSVSGRALMADRLTHAMTLAPAMRDAQLAQDEACTSSIKAAYAMLDSGDAGLGEVLLSWFAAQTFIGHQTAAYIAQHWLVRKVCFMPGRDAVRQGFTITSDDGEDLDPKVTQAFNKADEKYRLNAKLIDFVGKGRMYGVRLCLFKVAYDNPKVAYEAPFNPDAVKPGTYRGMVMIDPYWASPILDIAAGSDATDAHFYEPTWWQVNGMKIHRSHFAIFRNGDLPDILKPLYLFGGIPLPQMVAERVYCAERTANEAPQLAMTKRTTVLGVDAAKALANGDEFVEKLKVWAGFRDNYGVKVTDSETEKVEQFDTSLTDLDAVIMTQFQIVAAIAGVPSTKLMGTTPKGFNATGEYDEKNYHEELESLQTLDLSPLVERHHDLVMRSDIAPRLLGGKVLSTTTVWNPLDSPSSKEQAEAQLAQANRDNALVTAGAIDGQDVRNRLRKDRDSGYYGIEEAAPEEPLPIEMDPGLTVGEPGAPVLVGDAALDPIRIVSNQRFLDEAIVAAKLFDRDFDVQVSPVFVDEEGMRYRIVIDGHHSLAAAERAGVAPNYVEGDWLGSDYRVLTDA